VFDLLVIGGGITGAGVARDAALRGLRVALVEAHDYASGTSSRSSRLVHGGVRYLEHGELGLVFESSRERRTLQRIAPHLVRPLAFTWPVYRGARVPRWKLGAGLLLYDVLSLFRNQRHERLDAQMVHASEPALRTDALVGGARYWDAGTDDVRLTLAALDSAVRSRRPRQALVFHTDRGLEYGATAFRERLAKLGFRQSMNRPGKMTDNAYVESFFHSMKTEIYHGVRFATDEQLRLALRSCLVLQPGASSLIIALRAACDVRTAGSSNGVSMKPGEDSTLRARDARKRRA